MAKIQIDVVCRVEFDIGPVDPSEYPKFEGYFESLFQEAMENPGDFLGRYSFTQGVAGEIID